MAGAYGVFMMPAGHTRFDAGACMRYRCRTRDTPFWIHFGLTLRAVILGLLLGLVVSFSVYPNDAVVRGTFLIGHFLPISIFGVLVVGLLLNALAGRFNRKLMLRGPEFAVATAIALVACGYPSSGFYRGASQITAMPAHWLQTNSPWKNVDITSYVPGGSPTVAAGHVVDPPAAAAQLLNPQNQAFTKAAESLNTRQKQRLAQIAAQTPGTPTDPSDVRIILDAVNHAITQPQWAVDSGAQASSDAVKVALDQATAATEVQQEALEQDDATRADYWATLATQARGHAARALVAEASGGAIRGSPAGDGLLLSGMLRHPYTHDAYFSGRTKPGNVFTWPSQVPWDAWWPLIRLWGGFTACLGVLLLCLALIFHPQWSRRELLPYPIARFVEESVTRDEGFCLPNIMRNRLFWLAFFGLFALHGVNAISAYTDEAIPGIPLNFDFNPLKTLFPTLAQVSGNQAYFNPTIYPSVLAFAFFLTTSVSLSLGISMGLWMLLGAFVISSGVPFENSYELAGNGNVVRFGAYVAFAGIILYTGRRYYLNVAASAVGLKRQEQTPGYAVWAARLAVIMLFACVLILRTSGLAWGWSLVFVLLVMLTHVVMSRLVAETGAFFVQASWLPSTMLLGLLGFEAIGPTAFILLGVASLMIVGDPREAVMPFIVNALRIGDRSGKTSPAKLAPALGVMLIAGLVIAGITTLSFQYALGYPAFDRWSGQSMPSFTLDSTSQGIDEASSQGILSDTTTPSDTQRLDQLQPNTELIAWAMGGALLVLVTAAARLRLPWWPLHPLVFLVWGTYPMVQFSVSFLLGWLVKAGVVKIGGAKGYQALRPVAIGVIAGELFAALFWILIGLLFYSQGMEVKPFKVFPG